MTKSTIPSLYEQSPNLRKLGQAIARSQQNITLRGLVGSARSFVVAEAFKEADHPFLWVLRDKEEAAYCLNDLEQLIGGEEVLFYPGSYRRPYQIEETDNANVLLRAEVLNRINSRRKPAIIVTYPDALFEKVVTRKELERNTQKIKIGDTLSLDFLNEVLFEYQFHRVDFVTEPGEFAVRGGIVDVFSFSHDQPYRIEFFGDEIDSIRTFDVETQLSTEQVKKITVIPNVENKFLKESRESFLKYISPKTTLFVSDLDVIHQRIASFFEKAKVAFAQLSDEIQHSQPEELFISADALEAELELFPLVTFEVNPQSGESGDIIFNTKPQPVFNKKFDLLLANLNENEAKGYSNYLFCSSEQQAKRFHDIFDQIGKTVHYQTLVVPIHEGFIDDDLKVACYTDHQIFERYHKFQIKNGYAKKQAITLKELNKLTVGDYVTHIDHGIGKFGGLKKIDVEGKQQEAIKLMYGERDILYVSIHSLHKISKYTGKDGTVPKIYKLG